MAEAIEQQAPVRVSPCVEHVQDPGVWDITDKLLLALAALAALLPRMWSLSVAFSPREAAVMLTASHPWPILWTLLRQGADKYIPINLRFVPLVKLWNGVAGDGEFAMRMLPLALSLCALGLGYAAARQLLDRRPALIVLLLLAVNPYLVVMSRTLGYEALLLPLCALATYSFLRIYTGRAGVADYLLYMAAMCAALLVHFTPAALLIPFFVAFFAMREKRAGDVYAWLLVNMPVIALCAVSTPQWRTLVIANVQFAKDSHFMELYDARLLSSQMQFNIVFIEKYLNSFLTLGAFFPGSVYHKLNGFNALALFAVLPAFHVAMFYGLREYQDGLRARLFLVLALFGAGALGAGVTFFGYTYREGLIPVYLIFSIILAGGVHRFGGARLRMLFSVAVVLMFLGGWVSVRADEKVSADWRPVAHALRESVPPGASVMALDGWNASALTFYLKEDRDRVNMMFLDFAPVDVPGTDRYLSEIIVEPFHGHFFAYGDSLEKSLETSGQAWLLIQERNDDDPPHIDEIKRWVRSAAKSGIITVEERQFNTGGNGKQSAIQADMDSARSPIILLHLRLTGALDDFRYF